MKKLHNLFFLFLFTISFYGQTIPSYYNGLDLSLTGNDLFLELSTRITDTHSGIPYTGSPVDVWDACKQADEDPDISTNVLLIYGFDDTDGSTSTDRTRNKNLQDTGSGASGVWNREHVFSKSLANPAFGTDAPGPGTDVHNLRPADRDRNSERSNRKFTDGSGSSSIESTNGGWYPGDEWKGDVARIVMYMYLRYHGDGSQVSKTNCLPINVGFGESLPIDSNMIELFLNWNVEDPVSPFEANRNDVLSEIQMNRNPFIDNPYLATLVWGGLIAEDLWSLNNSSDSEAPSTPVNLTASNILDDSFNVSWDASTDNVGVYDYLVYLDGVYLQSTTSTSTTITNLNPSTSYNVTIKSRDAGSNLSETSATLNVSTLVGPKILFVEKFNDCANLAFNAYSEASNKDWGCETQFGENNSGSIGINGYQEDELSKDWLITNNAIDFDAETGEKISFYTDAAYGTTPLVLVYSSNYDGSSNPSDYTWSPVPNITIPIHSNGSGTEEVFTFTDVDISSITGAVYFALKYYSNGEPTRWTVDSFEITADNDNPDSDEDGVLNADDLCSNTPAGDIVNSDGCSNGQLDDDNDGIQNSDDICVATLPGEVVNSDGCGESQLDDDNDGIMNNVDLCLNTPTGEIVNADGCSNGQLDDDNDGVMNNADSCSNTTSGAMVDDLGCFTLPSSNFTIEVLSETCPGKNNGQLIIEANESYNYSIIINGEEKSFTNNLIVTDLEPKLYEFCISVEGETYEQCYTINIIEGTTVSGRSSVKSNRVSIEIDEGTAPFTIFVNKKELFETNSPSFSVDVKHGDIVEVKTAISCEGSFSKTIELIDTIVAYPNPTNGIFKIALPISKKEVTIELYTIHSQLISVKTYPIVYGEVQLTIEDQPSGLYIAKIHLDKLVVLKIVK